MLSLLLQTYSFYKNEEKRIDSDDNEKKFKHIFLGSFDNSCPGINLDWEFSQFFSKTAGASRVTLKKLILARAIYLEIDEIVKARNDLHLMAFNKIEDLEKAGIQESELFAKNNLKGTIGVLLYKRLENLTNRYFENIESSVRDVFEAFKDLSLYLKDNFEHCEPLNLSLQSNAEEALKNICK